MGLATSSVTRLVDQLERGLGTTLLNRSTRRVTMTAAGEVFYGQARLLLRHLALAEEAVRDLDSDPHGRLHIAMPMAFGRLRIMPLLLRFMQDHPAIKIDALLEDERSDLLALDIDIAIRIGPLPVSGALIAKRLAPHKRHVVATPDYLAQHGTPQQPKDLNDHVGLLFAYADTATSWPFMGTAEQGSIEIPSPSGSG